MRFVRFGERGAEKPGFLDQNDRIRDISGYVDGLQGRSLDPTSLKRFGEVDHDSLPIVQEGTRLCKPVERIGKIIGIGPNFHDAASLAGFKVNPEPTIFLKAASAACGPNDPIEIPRLATRVDWGVELAVVIGRTAKYVSIEDAMSHVAGFTLANDLTERSFQLQRGGQWSKGKSHDSFAPLGPYLVTPDEIPNLDEIELWLDVNGERQQSGTLGPMIFKVPYLISYLSRFMRLEAGDVIMTGTIAGVGLSFDPPRFLRPGDRISVGGTGLGTQESICIAG